MGEGPSAPLDPRSYPAKPVWQRMIIISAGVVMNLISAVFLAGAAYYIGVPYTPSVVDGVNAGSPAWVAGLQPDDRILQVGSDGSEDTNLRFPDLKGGVVMHGLRAKGQPVELTVERQSSRATLSPIPSPRYDPDGKFSTLGFTGARTTVLGSDPVGGLAFLEDKKLDLKAGDEIVAVDGERLPRDSRFDRILASQLRQRLQAKWNESAVLTIERPSESKDSKATQSLEVTLPPVPRLTLGLGFQVGPVTAVNLIRLAKKQVSRSVTFCRPWTGKTFPIPFDCRNSLPPKPAAK